jgi:hypothetical protein
LAFLSIAGLMGAVWALSKMPKSSDGSTSSSTTNHISVAFMGNSMFYFNDFPRFFEEISGYQVTQDSCLHGGASISSLLVEGNGMYPQFETNTSVVVGTTYHNQTIHDYGACTVPQLLLGWDGRLQDPGYAQPNDKNDTSIQNPCRQDSNYLDYAIHHKYKYSATTKHDHFADPPKWDFALINDNTRNPARASTRALALETLERFHVDWFLKTGVTPVFLWTHAYTVNSTAHRNMTGMDNVANFTSLTYIGYKQYVQLLELYLPEAQTPRIAPVGLAFLMVHEENFDLWGKLFHSDHLHASPSGTFLQGCVVYYTLMGRMPDKNIVLRDDMASLWHRARMMQHAWEPENPFPDKETAAYLYRIAERIMVEGHVPKSFIDYQNGEVADQG